MLVLAANLAIYEWGLKRRTRPALPVASIGNITLGGTGKTTTTRRLARDLLARGVSPGIVLRGHGRRSDESVLLVADGAEAATEAGDEAAMLARTAPGALVAVGKRREHVIKSLAARGAQVALLDDGFQYFRMERGVDLVLIDATFDLAAARWFPRGYLREPLSHLRRATHVMMTHCDLAPRAHVDRTVEMLGRLAPRAPVMRSRHVPTVLYRIAEPKHGEPATALAGRGVVAMSGIGNPASFEGMLLELGATVVARAAFPDHHNYTASDWDVPRRALRGRDADLIVVTEKDLVKLPPPPDDLPPVAAVAVDLQITDGEAAWEAMVTSIANAAR